MVDPSDAGKHQAVRPDRRKSQNVSLLDQIQHEFDRGVEEVQRFLASERGVRLRHQIAAGLVAAAPAIAVATRKRLPVIGRIAGGATIAAVVMNVAGKIRDWQPHEFQRP